MPRPVEVSDETQETFTLLVFTLVREGSVHSGPPAGAADAADQYRSSLRSELDGTGPFQDLAAYDVIPGANARWAGGGIDVVIYREPGGLEAAMSVVIPSQLPCPPTTPSPAGPSSLVNVRCERRPGKESTVSHRGELPRGSIAVSGSSDGVRTPRYLPPRRRSPST